jgi:ABC-type transport system involved in multi-copper enzyme maturation permease subunit
MIAQWSRQILAVIRLEMSKTFFARRGLWVYLLAFAPVVLYAGRSIYVPRERDRLAQLARSHPVSSDALRAIRPGFTADQVASMLGEPYFKRVGHHRAEGGRLNEHCVYKYTDGKSDFMFRFTDGALTRIHRMDPQGLQEASLVFATIFQFYFLRLAVFFGCAGIFMNLFRGEMLDKSLHFYLLTPIRREVLLIGKYLAGLIATVVIFTSSAGLQLVAMLWQFDRPTILEYFAGPGWVHLAAYMGVTVLACVGYGSIFLAAGMLFRSPIIPAAVILLWESANLFLPAALKKISLIFYVQSLCPVVASPETNMPLPIMVLIASAKPATPAAAVGGVLIFTLLVLLASAFQSRRLEINYSAD